MSSPSAQQGARGGRVTLIFQSLKIVVQVLSVVVLARLLEPDDFGIIAMAAVVISLGDLLRDLGLSVSALQARLLSTQQSSNLFWANSALGLVAACLVALSAPIMSGIYKEPILNVLIPVLGITVLISGLHAQYRIRLAREFRFLALNLSELVAHVLGLAGAAVSAIAGLGVWALVIQALMVPITLLLMTLTITRWIPNRPRRDGATMPLIRSGMHHTGTAILGYASANADSFMIGARFGSAELGLYNRAFQLLTVPVQRLIGSLTPVAVTTLNSAKAAGEDVYKHILRLQSLLATVTTLLFVLAAVTADPLIPFLLGKEWRETAVLFRILAIGGAALSLSQVSYWVFLTLGTSRDLLNYTLLSKPIVIAMVVLASSFSLEAIAWSYSAGLLVSWVINVIWVGVVAAAPLRSLLANGFRVLSAGGLAAVISLAVPFGAQIDNLALLAAARATLAVVSFALLISFTKDGREDLRWLLSRVPLLRRYR